MNAASTATWLSDELLILCACTGTVLLSVLAVGVASYEVSTGRSRNPLLNDPRHRRHRQEQRARSFMQSRPTHSESEVDSAMIEIIREIRDATEPPECESGKDHNAVARGILPAAYRLRGLERRGNLGPQQRRAILRFRRLLEQYAAENGGWHTTDRETLRANVHQAASNLEQTLRPDAADRSADES